MAWMVVFGVLSAFFFTVAAYHSWALPRPGSDTRNSSGRSAADIFKEFFDTFRSFFRKKQIWVAIAFMLLYRLPEAQLVKLINPFLLDPVDIWRTRTQHKPGRIRLWNRRHNGTYTRRHNRRYNGRSRRSEKMAVANGMVHVAHLPDIRISQLRRCSIAAYNKCMRVHRAVRLRIRIHSLYALPDIYFSEGSHKTAHYAICTGFTWLSA